MSACEECWNAAYFAARTRGGSQADHYRDELEKHAEHAPAPVPTEETDR